MDDDDDKSQKIQIIAFTTNEKDRSPYNILSIYFDNNNHNIIKKNQQLLAFSTTLPGNKKSTKVMICTLIDLNIEYEGLDDVNCYIIIIDLQKDSSKDKYSEIISFINNSCDVSKKIFLLGVKDNKENDEIKISQEEIEKKIKELKRDYDYFELNLDNSQEISDKILEILNYSFTNSIDLKQGGEDKSHSCLIF